jgi:hypothetical protein
MDFIVRRGIARTGHSAPFMSPAAGLGPSAPPLLHCAERPARAIGTAGGMRFVPCHWRFEPGAAGAGRSEVKEEEGAKPFPGDMSGARHPSALARAKAVTTTQTEH